MIDFSIGDPDLITDQEIIEAAFKDVKNGQTKYTEASGDIELLQAISGFYDRTYNLQFSTSQIRATVGACHAMYLALQAIIDPGDELSSTNRTSRLTKIKFWRLAAFPSSFQPMKKTILRSIWIF